MFEKRPRHYCAEIVALPTREERVAALNEVPDTIKEPYRKWVADLVMDHWAKNRGKKA